ncbi:hypothetical protein GLOTRDRAFT_115914 [Gloeophyllum trabeum ATCC 11539]|uniref:Ribosomal protein bL31m N-terminal domain-containing protein n=1 Tax=Gloeophyllum trabeum (strain ATCC 11539 / FP-39264 / Madison 617) TaxID=670483 RepID=S7RMC4_GLOTA|nr:uncharacterized protein GLOTRDRAFT_115914 [Gloeophyllum trabeum ATCC 11539]EPQ55570.1 hypothetical protein GLOTRDRAFT_115914 [Gloeophyllum trabeum ATCC 11539]
MTLSCAVASSSRSIAATSRSLCGTCQPARPLVQTRLVSSSPYGRTHVWKRRPNKLPNPIVPQFPQKVVRSDGSTFIHWTTSPRSLIRLTRDVTNNPLWNTAMMRAQGAEEESETTGRLGRFSRRFGGGAQEGVVDWENFSELAESEKASAGAGDPKASKS